MMVMDHVNLFKHRIHNLFLHCVQDQKRSACSFLCPIPPVCLFTWADKSSAVLSTVTFALLHSPCSGGHVALVKSTCSAVKACLGYF